MSPYHCDKHGVDAEIIERETGDHIATVHRLRSQTPEQHAAIAASLTAAPAMLAALRLAKPVCADAYYDALAVQENPTGDAVNYPAENAQSTAAALAAWEAVNAAIALADGRQPEPLGVPEADTPDAKDAAPETEFLCVGYYDDGSRFAENVTAANAEDAEAIAESQWPAVNWAGFVALRDGVMTVEG